MRASAVVVICVLTALRAADGRRIQGGQTNKLDSDTLALDSRALAAQKWSWEVFAAHKMKFSDLRCSPKILKHLLGCEDEDCKARCHEEQMVKAGSVFKVPTGSRGRVVGIVPSDVHTVRGSEPPLLLVEFTGKVQGKLKGQTTNRVVLVKAHKTTAVEIVKSGGRSFDIPGMISSIDSLISNPEVDDLTSSEEQDDTGCADILRTGSPGPDVVDFRRCWGKLVDLPKGGSDPHRLVCGDDALTELKEDLQALTDEDLKRNETGKSGAFLVLNPKSFIIKDLKDWPSWITLWETMQTVGSDMKNRQKGPEGCWSTALAPICFAVRDSSGVFWMAMRKASLEGETSTKISVDGESIGMFDLKGPRFAEGWKDGKTRLSAFWESLTGTKDKLWRKKDVGFKTQFPQGWQLRSCGARDSSYAATRDSKMLSSGGLTDYSLLLMFYEEDEAEGEPCTCVPGDPPRFPVVLHVAADEKSGLPRMRSTLGIIDYIEDQVRTGVASYMSTMKNSAEFSNLWLSVFPDYFRLPARSVKKEATAAGQSAVIFEPGRAEEAPIKVGGEPPKDPYVVALQRMKWTSHCNDPSPQGISCVRTEQMTPHDTGSSFKVYPGRLGKLVMLTKRGLYVKWEDDKDLSTLDDAPDSQEGEFHSGLMDHQLPGELFWVQADQVSGVPAASAEYLPMRDERSPSQTHS